MTHPNAGRPAGRAPDPDVLEKEQAVVNLRRTGLTWDQIAKRVGYGYPSSARDAYYRANARIVRDDVEELRKIEEDRLDLAQAAIWTKVLQGDYQAIQTLLKIMDRRAKLLGLDQPTKIQAEVVSYDGAALRASAERAVSIIRQHSIEEGRVGSDTGEAGADT
jgi:hypothetical protein